MFTRRALIKASTVITAVAAFASFPVAAQEPLSVVATFSILGDMVEKIGGSAVSVTTLVGSNGDTHVYQPTPADAKAVKEATVLFTNGLEFEGWLDRLAEAAEFNGELVVTTDGMEFISTDEHGDEHHDGDKQHNENKDDEHHDGDAHQDENEDEEHHDHHHGEFDPHGWQSLTNAIVYINNITAALAKASPENAATFYENRAEYITRVKALDNNIKELISALPDSARTIVTSHDAFQYFGRDYGLTFIAPLGLSTESEASARDVAKLIKQIHAENISAVFVENVADPRLLQQIANETGTIVGGKLYPGALSDADGPAASYLDLMQHNAGTIANALAGVKEQ